jgi:hypothetical protein
VVVDLHYFHEEQDPPIRIIKVKKLDPDPHSSDADPQPFAKTQQLMPVAAK